MTDQEVISNKHQTVQFNKTTFPFLRFNRPVLLSLLVFFILIVLFTLLILQRYQLAKESREKEAFEIVHQAKDKLQVALAHSLAATKVLAFLIDKNGQVNNFDSVAAQVLESVSDIDAVQLVPGGVIQYIYPLKGNEKVIGYNILQDSARNKEAFKAIEQKSMYFAGPFELRQGGMGVVGRLPVYRQNKFWGFSAAVIKMSTLCKVAGIDSSGKNGYYFQLSKINPDSKEEEFFLPRHKELSGKHAVSVEVPNGEWKLSVYSSVTSRVLNDLALLAGLAFLLSVLGSLFAYRVAIKPKKLKELVLNRTSELKASEKKYRSVIERVSDAFVALDVNWKYTYVNEKAGEILAREPESLVGENMWVEFPDKIHQPFYQTCNSAMQMQEYQYLEEYDPSLNKWIENHIYPSTDGLTIFFKDVTEIKQITLALKIKEEKYRTLIEQASDGIVITDLEGVIIEVNNSIKEMIGYGEEEMIGSHLTRYLPEQDIDGRPLRINELMQGKSLLYERKLVKKDGTIIDVEINSKMASSHTLIGFIRDITERKKHENTLLYQARLLESVSDAITSLDMNRCIVSWNKACEDLYGFTAVDVIGKKIPELISFEYPDTNNEAVFKEVFTEGQWKGEFNFIHPKTGEKVNLLSGINLLKNKEGIVNGFIITSNNITHLKKVEEEIRTSKERFELIAEATNDAIWDHDFVKNETWGNKKLYNLYGFPAEQKINFEMFLEHIHPDERAAILTRMKHAMDSSQTSLSETFLFKTDKGYKTFFDRAYIKYDDGGNPIRILGAMQDITEREKAAEILQQSEKKYKLLFNNNPIPMLMTTIPGLDIIDVNEAAVKQYGYTREAFLQMNARDLQPVENIEAYIHEVEKMQAGITNTRAWRHKRKDGAVIEVETYSHQVMYEGKMVWLKLIHDVTEKHEAKELLQKSYEDIRQLAANLQTIREDERTTIAREIHDELGQQLTGLKLDLHWLIRKMTSADDEIIAKIKESVELINATIASVRKISTNLRPSILDDLGLLPALEWHSDEFEKRSGTKVDFINDVGDITVPPEVATGIFRIYQELLTNIARHANASLVKATLSKDDSMVYFCIQDNGVGFDLETIRSKRTLGLLGIKERTLLFGGSYEFISKPGEGSVTTISIPLRLVKTKNQN